jgi:hypothetical protein
MQQSTLIFHHNQEIDEKKYATTKKDITPPAGKPAHAPLCDDKVSRASRDEQASSIHQSPGTREKEIEARDKT